VIFFVNLVNFAEKTVARAGLKPMQPMRLHWPRASGGPAPFVWIVVH